MTTLEGLSAKVDLILRRLDNLEEEFKSFRENRTNDTLKNDFYGQNNWVVSKPYEIDEDEDFKCVNLTWLYNRKFSFHGSDIYKRINAMSRFFLTEVTHNPMKIWFYSLSTRTVDDGIPKRKLPSNVKNQISDIMLHSLNLYVPPEILYSDMSLEKEHNDFYEKLGNNDQMRRKKLQEIITARSHLQSFIEKSMCHVLHYVKEYHYDVRDNMLKPCKNSCSIISHLKWKNIKEGIQNTLKNVNIDDYLNTCIDEVHRAMKNGLH